LLDDLRALIWAHYDQQLLDEISDGQMSGDANQSASSLDDLPFFSQQSPDPASMGALPPNPRDI